MFLILISTTYAPHLKITRKQPPTMPPPSLPISIKTKTDELVNGLWSSKASSSLISQHSFKCPSNVVYTEKLCRCAVFSSLYTVCPLQSYRVKSEGFFHPLPMQSFPAAFGVGQKKMFWLPRGWENIPVSQTAGHKSSLSLSFWAELTTSCPALLRVTYLLANQGRTRSAHLSLF